AGFDRTHNLQLYGNVELPFGRGKKYANSGFASKMFGGWQANWILSRTSGLPLKVTTSETPSNPPGKPRTPTQALSMWPSLAAQGVGQPYFDPNAFAPVTAVRFGNTGRDILRGPGVFNLDGSLFRNFKMTERFTLQFRAECFGVTNTPQFANPGATASNLTRNSDGSIRSLSGFTEITTATGERQFRFAAKISF